MEEDTLMPSPKPAPARRTEPAPDPDRMFGVPVPLVILLASLLLLGIVGVAAVGSLWVAMDGGIASAQISSP